MYPAPRGHPASTSALFLARVSQSFRRGTPAPPLAGERPRQAAGAAVGAALPAPALAGVGTNPRAPLTSVIVKDVPGLAGQAEHAVTSLGGTVGRRLGLIDGFPAKMPADRVVQLQSER